MSEFNENLTSAEIALKLARWEELVSKMGRLIPESADYGETAETEETVFLTILQEFFQNECHGDVEICVHIIKKYLAQIAIQLRNFLQKSLSEPEIQAGLAKIASGDFTIQEGQTLHKIIQDSFAMQRTSLPDYVPFLKLNQYRTSEEIPDMAFAGAFGNVTRALKLLTFTEDQKPAYTQLADALEALNHDLQSSRFGEALKHLNAQPGIDITPALNDILLRHIAPLEADLRKCLACLDLLAYRLDSEHQLAPNECDVVKLLELDRQSLQARFPYGYKIVNKLEHGRTIRAIESAILLIIDNISKNAFKMMRGKEKSKECSLTWHIFERDKVLFLECSDEAGGIDLSAILRAGQKKAADTIRANTAKKVSRILQLLRKGSYHTSHPQHGLTLHDVYDLIFEEYLTAREGGSGIGLGEAKDLVGKQKGYITATNSATTKGAKLLIALPFDKMTPEDLEKIVWEAQQELDREEMNQIGNDQSKNIPDKLAA